ncbi:hypothetical protein KUTeg_010459 [Tegillarca granosa]|uniref:Uncharacterized protein n=1 Tax=Tegillarca granosa TaxID=220873 RepID=A0ABQ9F6T1_TEGGR|nr:hypothetical protein KUTeg_010459 [Tegillarca granosa]
MQLPFKNLENSLQLLSIHEKDRASVSRINIRTHVDTNTMMEIKFPNDMTLQKYMTNAMILAKNTTTFQMEQPIQ